MTLSWLVAANHCAIANGQLFGATVEESASCHSPESEMPTPGMEMQCGDALNSPLPPTLVAPPAQLFVVKPAWIEAETHCFEALPVDAQTCSGRAPPGSTALVDLFLARRLLAHAPPVPIA